MCELEYLVHFNTAWVPEEELSISDLLYRYNCDLLLTRETIKVEEIDSSLWENDNTFKDPSLAKCKEIKLEEIDSTLQRNVRDNEQRSLGTLETIEIDPDFAIQQRELYNCFHCSAQFHYKSMLNDHIRTHTNEKHTATKEHQCEQCRSVFNLKGSLTKHIRTVHSDIKDY